MGWPWSKPAADPQPKWEHRYDELAEYNALRGRAAGSQYSTLDDADTRAVRQQQAKALLDALSPEYVQRMADLQAEYKAKMQPWFDRETARFRAGLR